MFSLFLFVVKRRNSCWEELIKLLPFGQELVFRGLFLFVGRMEF
jgi:hypothetical protein